MAGQLALGHQGRGDARHSGHRPAFESWLFQLTVQTQARYLPACLSIFNYLSGCSVKRKSGRKCQQLVLMCTLVLFEQGPFCLVCSHEPGGSCAHWSQPPSAVFKQASLLSQKAPPRTWPGTLILEGAEDRGVCSPCSFSAEETEPWKVGSWLQRDTEWTLGLLEGEVRSCGPELHPAPLRVWCEGVISQFYPFVFCKLSLKITLGCGF